MIEIIPFLLFWMEWQTDRPEDVLLSRHSVVYVDEAQCLEAGAALVDEAVAAQENAPEIGPEIGQEDEQEITANVSFSCQPMPPREEFDSMMEREFGENGA